MTHYEDIGSVKVSKLQLLMTKYESLRTEETESVFKFSARIKNLTNSAWKIGSQSTDVLTPEIQDTGCCH